MKQKGYWLRGGIIGLVVGLTSYIYPYTLYFVSGPIVNFWCNNYVFPKIMGDNKGCNISTPLTFVLILLVILGVLLGWIYGKMKSRKAQENMS